ncbi:MAG: class I SAM-dependent methyltransferase [Ferruginibacter sp.]|nr:class I SAM-dependent methyltransferase [Ferruginibacter sp.]
MLNVLEAIFESGTMEINSAGERIPLHSNTSKEQGIFLQKIFDRVKPANSLEVGFAYGISAMFILEKHREAGSEDGAHLVIEPDSYWGTVAIHNIEKEGLTKYLQIRRDYSDKILTQLYHQNHRIQYAYIDTTKQFDTVLQDFYFINKILDVGGVVILDDCGGGWPGVQRVARFISSLPHYKILEGYNKIEISLKRQLAQSILSFTMGMLPFKKKCYPTINFKTDAELGLDYTCIAFQKEAGDSRSWDWDKTF